MLLLCSRADAVLPTFARCNQRAVVGRRRDALALASEIYFVYFLLMFAPDAVGARWFFSCRFDLVRPVGGSGLSPFSGAHMRVALLESILGISV